MFHIQKKTPRLIQKALFSENYNLSPENILYRDFSTSSHLEVFPYPVLLPLPGVPALPVLLRLQGLHHHSRQTGIEIQRL